MQLDNIPLFDQLNGKLGWLARNHQVLAENLANADTPGYMAMQLRPSGFARMLQTGTAIEIGLVTTDNAHIDGSSAGSGSKARAIDDPYDVVPTGNSVSLDEQAVLVAKNAMEYQLAASIYSKSLKLMKMALGRNN